MFIYNSYYQSFNFKLRDVININSASYKFSQKNTNMTIHNTLLIITFNLIFFLFSPILYKSNFYNTLFLTPYLFLFLSRKTFSKII